MVLIRLLSFQILCTFLWIDLFRLIFAVTLISCGECFHSKTSHLYTYYHFRGENSNRLQYTHHPWDNLFAYCFSTFFKREYDMFRSPCRPHLINIRLKWLIINRRLRSWFPFFFWSSLCCVFIWLQVLFYHSIYFQKSTSIVTNLSLRYHIGSDCSYNGSLRRKIMNVNLPATSMLAQVTCFVRGEIFLLFQGVFQVLLLFTLWN